MFAQKRQRQFVQKRSDDLRVAGEEWTCIEPGDNPEVILKPGDKLLRGRDGWYLNGAAVVPFKFVTERKEPCFSLVSAVWEESERTSQFTFVCFSSPSCVCEEKSGINIVLVESGSVLVVSDRVWTLSDALGGSPQIVRPFDFFCPDGVLKK